MYSFAFVPWMKAHMKDLSEESLPGPDLKLALFGLARRAFLDAGYRQIGMDHFAVPEDELARALEHRVLHRNFMGYTVQSARDMVALGVSGIGDVQGTFVQNTKKLNEYYAALDEGRFPIERGYALDRDDEIRRHVITTLMCNGYLAVADVERRFGIVVRGVLRGGAGGADGGGLAAGRRTDRGHPRRPRSDAARPAVRQEHLHGVRSLSAGAHHRRHARFQQDRMTAPRIIIVGAGITGLSVAVTLREEARRLGAQLDLVVLERNRLTGGHARTVAADGFVVEAGPNGS